MWTCRVGTKRPYLFPDRVSLNLPPNRTYTFPRIRLSSYSSVLSWRGSLANVLPCMDCLMAGFAHHQGFPVQGGHRQHPVRDVLAALVIFLLDVPEFTDVVYFKLAG